MLCVNIETVGYLFLIIAGPILAIVAHEMTHYITIWPVAEEVTIHRKSRWQLETVYQLYNDPWRMRWADISNISPSIIGAVALIYAIATGFDPFVLERLWLIPTWLVYTVGGSADYAGLFG